MKRKTFTKKQRKEISTKTNNKCCYCGEYLNEVFHVAHIIPFIQLKARNIIDNDFNNYMASCPQCNRFERGGGLEFFRGELMEQTKTALRDSVNYRFALKYNQIVETPTPIVFYFETLDNNLKKPFISSFEIEA